MKKLSTTDQAVALYHLGISYHDYGTIKNGKKIVATYFKCDKVTTEQFSSLKELDDSAYLASSGYEYAPEVEKVLVCFKTKAQIKREKLQG